MLPDSQMLRDLASKSSRRAVPELQAAVVFDAVVRNGQPDAGSTRGRTAKYYAIDSTSGRRDETPVNAKHEAPVVASHIDGYLCWSSFLEAMVNSPL